MASLLSFLLVTAMVALSFILMAAILTLILRDLRKKDADRLVALEESYTTHFVMSIILGLLCKALIVDAFLKGELDDELTCSMFIGDYLPEIFMTSSNIYMTCKCVLMLLEFRETEIAAERKRK